ncbi:hypothetical protein GCM10010252_35610 [Streptomyces aureoverticillatus]|nr:hypothetical protein GCM10010252_35610 [Streptomyces aureoverticillatus]
MSPLRRASTLATLAAVLDEPVPPPVRSGPLAPVLEALLVRDPALRPEAARLDAMLAAVADGVVAERVAWQPTETAPRPVPPPPVSLAQTPPAPTPPAPTRPAGPPHREPRGRTPVVVAALSVVVALVAAAALVVALRDGSEQNGKAGGETTTGAGPSGSRAPTKTASRTPTATPSTSPTKSASPSRSTPPTSATPTAPPASGRWIAQLHSEPGTSSAATRDRRLAAVRKQVPEAQYLRSDDYASLRPGFWVFYAPGPFADGRAALRFCAERGRTSGNTCVGRYLSDNSGDYALQCKPPVSSPAGRCTRP